MTDKCDLVVKGGPLWAAPDKYWPKGRVEISRGKVLFSGDEDESQTVGQREIDARGGLIMPGLVNGHCHGPMVLFRGLSDDLPLERWLFDVMFPAEAKWINDETTYTATLLAASEMLLDGVTCVQDAYFCMNGVAKAYQEVGMRAVVGHGVIDFPAPGIADPSRKLKVVEEFIRAWQGVDPLITPALFAHSVSTCSPGTLEAVAGLARELDCLWFTHLSETRVEVEQVREKYRLSPVRHLEELGLLQSLSLGAHGVWLDPGELQLLAENQVALVHCPESNLKLASGQARVRDWLSCGIISGLGTDGAASNNDLDMIGEIGTAARLAKLTHDDPAALSANQACAMAMTGSAEAMGLGKVAGALLPGYAADLLILDRKAPHLAPSHDPASTLAYQARRGDVRQVLVNGRQVVKDGRLLTVDLPEVMARVREMARKVAKG